MLRSTFTIIPILLLSTSLLGQWERWYNELEHQLGVHVVHSNSEGFSQKTLIDTNGYKSKEISFLDSGNDTTYYNYDWSGNQPSAIFIEYYNHSWDPNTIEYDTVYFEVDSTNGIIRVKQVDRTYIYHHSVNPNSEWNLDSIETHYHLHKINSAYNSVGLRYDVVKYDSLGRIIWSMEEMKNDSLISYSVSTFQYRGNSSNYSVIKTFKGSNYTEVLQRAKKGKSPDNIAKMKHKVSGEGNLLKMSVKSYDTNGKLIGKETRKGVYYKNGLTKKWSQKRKHMNTKGRDFSEKFTTKFSYEFY